MVGHYPKERGHGPSFERVMETPGTHKKGVSPLTKKKAFYWNCEGPGRLLREKQLSIGIVRVQGDCLERYAILLEKGCLPVE